jgi:DNA invertase Pin-like site-specific DNA recombinase
MKKTFKTQSKKKLIENCIKKHEYIWASQIARETSTTLATVIKWIKILKLENKITIEKFDGMNLIRWKREKSEINRALGKFL